MRATEGFALLIVLGLVAGCATPPPKAAVAVAAVKVIKPAHTVEEVQAAFDDAVRAMTQLPPDYPTAREGFKAALKASPQFPAARFNLGLVELALGNADRAEVELRAALDMLADDQRTPVLLALSRSYLEADRLADAETALQQILAKDPENLVVKHNLALLYRKQKDWNTALKFLREILAREAKNLAALNELGLLYLDQGNLPMAEWVLGKAIQFSKETPNGDVLNNMGLVWLAKGESPAAVKFFQQAVAADPSHVEARKNLAAVYVQYLNFTGAQDQYTAVLGTHESDLEARLGLATSLFGLSQFEPAAAEYKRVVDAVGGNPRNDQQKSSLAASHKRLGALYNDFLRDQEKALEHYKQWVLHGNPASTDPLLAQITLLEDMVKRGVRSPEPEAKKERPSAPAGAAGVTLEGVDIGAAMQADPDAPPEAPAPEGAAPVEGAAPTEGGPAAPASTVPAGEGDGGGGGGTNGGGGGTVAPAAGSGQDGAGGGEDGAAPPGPSAPSASAAVPEAAAPAAAAAAAAGGGG